MASFLAGTLKLSTHNPLAAAALQHPRPTAVRILGPHVLD